MSKKPQRSAYSKEDLRAIAKAIPTSFKQISRIRVQLETAALWYRLATRSPRRARPSELRSALLRISNTARRLLRDLGIHDPSLADDGPENDAIVEALAESSPGDHDLIIQAAGRIGRLEELVEAAFASHRLSRRATNAADEVIDLGSLIVPKRNTSSDPVLHWIESVVPLYEKAAGTEARTSTSPSDGAARGPLIRFLKAAAKPMGLEATEESWRNRFRRLKKRRKAK